MRNSEKPPTFASLLREKRSKSQKGDSLAQLVEHNTFNVGVLGSSPRRITEGFINPTKTSENHRFSEVLLYALYPQSQQNIEVSGVHKGGNRNCTMFCHL